MEKFTLHNTRTGETEERDLLSTLRGAVRLGDLRKQRAFLIERLGVFRVACVTLRVRKKRVDAEVLRLRAELAAERVESAKWRDTAERCFSAAMKNAVALANERKGKMGE